MLKNRHFISYFSTTLLYLLVAGFFFYLQKHTLVSTENSEEKVLTMQLSEFVPEVLPPVEEPVEEPIDEPIVEEVVIEPEVIEESIVEKARPKPSPIKVEKKVKKKAKKPKIKKPKVKKSKQKKQKTKKRASKRKTSQRASSQTSPRSKAAKNQFLANIRNTINRHKTYPKMAKRRRMQGSVKVKFTILASGKVGNITLQGPKIFYASARKAVKSAFPVNAKKSPLHLPQTVNLTLRYYIR